MPSTYWKCSSSRTLPGTCSPNAMTPAKPLPSSRPTGRPHLSRHQHAPSYRDGNGSPPAPFNPHRLHHRLLRIRSRKLQLPHHRLSSKTYHAQTLLRRPPKDRSLFRAAPTHPPAAVSTATPIPTSSRTAPTSPPEDEYFFVKSGRALQKILLKDILYFEGEKEYVRVVTPVHKLLVYRRLKDIEEQLSASFARVHNSYIVNIARLESIRDNQIFVGGKQIPISEKFREAFMNRIKERVF